MKLIYVVEDHQVIREGVRRYLELAGYKVLGFGTLASVRDAFRITKADLLIQDVMLPDGDGFDFVRELRQQMDIPVIFMTARVAEEDRIQASVEVDGKSPREVKELSRLVRRAVAAYVIAMADDGDPVPQLESLQGNGVAWDWMKPCYHTMLTYNCIIECENE